MGETMAQLLARISCESGSTMTCSQVPSSDVLYANVWTTGLTLPAGDVDANVSYAYAGTAGLSETPPTNANCVPWSAQCRITIHYANAANATQLFIQSIWNLSTRSVTVAGVATPAVCVTCHNSVNAANAIQVPTGQLDLTGGASSVDTTVVTSYEQLLFPHDEQQLNMGTLQNLLVPGPPGANGAPTMVPVQLASPMTAGSANDSVAKFLGIFDPNYQDPNAGLPGEVDHRGFLTPAELRLISEWLDIGGQYYNDPFVAPVAN
jgi:hypothetical protein